MTRRCAQELCEHWSGDGDVCQCAVFGWEPDVAKETCPWSSPTADPLGDIQATGRAAWESSRHASAIPVVVHNEQGREVLRRLGIEEPGER